MGPGVAWRTVPTPADRPERLEPLIEAMGPPLSRAPWSPHFAAQSLEVLPVGLDRGEVFWLMTVPSRMPFKAGLRSWTAISRSLSGP